MRNARNAHSSSVIDQLESRRLFAAGALDTTFSSDGKTAINISDNTVMSARDVALQKDGKVVVVGRSRDTASSANFRVAVARFNLDGTPDTTFGNRGNGLFRFNIGDANDDRGRCIAIQGDGKIVIGSFSTTDALFGQSTNFGVARLNTNGTLDKSFAGDGTRIIDFSGFANDIVIQQVGTTNGIVEKIVVVGQHDDGFAGVNDNFAIARLNPDGKLDGTFDGDGKRQVGFGEDESAGAVAIDTQNRIVVAGSKGSSLALTRLTGTNGATDTSFGQSGTVVTSIPGFTSFEASNLLIQSGNRIVVVGSAVSGTNRNFVLARYLSNGKLDTTFGVGGTGIVVTDFGSTDIAGGAFFSADGGLIVSGNSGAKFALASYTADGVLKSSFGNGGKIVGDLTGAGSASAGGVSVAKGPGRRFVIAGGRFGAARFLDAGGNVVSAGTFLPRAFEEGVRSTSFIVGRTERLPVATRVFFSVSGTATVGKLFLRGQPNPNDYSLTNMVVPVAAIGGGGTPYVDIPAGQTFVNVIFTPIDDTRGEGDETAIFSILPNANYELGTNRTMDITIFDNDLKTLNATADAYVRDGADASKNFGSATELQVKNSGTGFNRQAYLKFDIGSLSTINSVKLRLFGSLSHTARTNVGASVFAVDNTSWSESAINFNNKPANGTGALGGLTVLDATGRFYEVDLTSYIRAQKAAGKTAVSFMLKANVSVDPFIRFNSREAGNGPQLLVT
jgi:uncharacterized delta-60 repeat protein